ncbi:MAG: hypothetical protein RMN51_07220 [Verrucomicrobiota bacterium]|nr:hypothetical protein [Limisphaera sp.]MDW8381882.1 hypothetical protein [Verrucomicrobiota bacterium]
MGQEQPTLNVGLMNRDYLPLGRPMHEVPRITLYACQMHGPVGTPPRPGGMRKWPWQITHYKGFTRVDGGFIADWLIHSICLACGAKNA